MRTQTCVCMYLQVFVRGNIKVKASEVELWWPVGMGSQPLYNLTVTYASWSTWSDLIGLIGDAIGSIGDSLNDLIGFDPNAGAAPQQPAGGAAPPVKPSRAEISAAAAAVNILRREEREGRAAHRRRSLLAEEPVDMRVVRRQEQAEQRREWQAPPTPGYLQHAPQFDRVSAEQQQQPGRRAEPAHAPQFDRVPAAAAGDVDLPQAASQPSHAPQFPEDPEEVARRKKRAGKEVSGQEPAGPTRREGEYNVASVRAAHSRVRRLVSEGKLSPAFFPGLQRIDSDDFMSTINRRIGFRHVEVRVEESLLAGVWGVGMTQGTRNGDFLLPIPRLFPAVGLAVAGRNKLQPTAQPQALRHQHLLLLLLLPAHLPSPP